MKITKNGHEFDVVGKCNRYFWTKFQSPDLWEPETFKIFDRFLQKNDTMIDIGAWIGPTVLYASKLCNEIWAIEPDMKAYNELCDNVIKNGLRGKVKVSNVAISDFNETTKIAVKKGQSFGKSLTCFDSVSNIKNKEVAWCKAERIETFVKNRNIKKVDFVKMDIEGGEIKVLPDMINFLNRFKPTFYLSVHPHLLDIEQNDKLFTTVSNIVNIYKHVYDKNGRIINDKYMMELFNKKESFSIVFSNKRWQI